MLLMLMVVLRWKDIYLLQSQSLMVTISPRKLAVFDVETEPANAIEIVPVKGFLNSDGLASLKFKRTSSSSSMGRINCKVYCCKEDEVCLYQSVAFDVKFREEAVPSPAQITLSYSVVPRDTSGQAVHN